MSEDWQKLNAETQKAVLNAQRNEITEHHIYTRLAKRLRKQGDKANAEVLERIAADEQKHYDFWHRLSGKHSKPNKRFLHLVINMAKLFGVTFSVKLMERGEDIAQKNYEKLKAIRGTAAIIHDEEKHEKTLLNILKEERLEYAGSIVLGLNDALVELTGALAGFTLALPDARIISIAGLVTGIAASLSMAASNYLETRQDKDHGGKKQPIKSATYTGIAYFITVLILVAPFFILNNVFVALGITLTAAVLIIAFFNFYISVAKGTKFWKEFFTMAAISLGVAGLSFCIAFLLRAVLGVEV